MNHFTTSRFWSCYEQLPEETRVLADKQYAPLKSDPSHPLLHFKKVGNYWSVRVRLSVRALAVPDGDDLVGFWIGNHREYERIINRS